MLNQARQFEGMHAGQALIKHYAALQGSPSVFGVPPKVVVATPELKVGCPLSIPTMILAGMACLYTGGVFAGTTSATMSPWTVGHIMPGTVATGYRREHTVTSSEMVADVRLRLGLTWIQVASVFDVSRRAVHAWASGEKLSSKHAEQLRVLHSRVVGSTDLASLRSEIIGDTLAPTEHRIAMKGAILSSAELGIAGNSDVITRRISTNQLRRG